MSELFCISDNKEALQPAVILSLLRQTYWAAQRTAEQMETAIGCSLCYGAYESASGRQVGFARVVTDFVCFYYICDVVVDEDFRGQGVGKALMAAISSDGRFNRLRGLLVTASAHGLYEQYGFTRADDMHMGKAPVR